MKIAIIADPIDNQKGGVHVYTRELVNALLANPGKHSFLLIRERKDPELTGAQQVAIPNIRIGLGLAALRLFFLVPLVLRWHRVDAVLEPAHFGPFNLPGRIKRITMIHDLTPLRFPQYHRFHSQLLQRIFLKGILKRAHLVLANSWHTASDIEAYFPFTRGKVRAIHLGCDPSFRENPDRSIPDRLDVGPTYWLNVGTIEPRKNLSRLLEAYRQFREGHPERIPLVITGQRGWKADTFYEALEAHPNKDDIILTGYVSDEALSMLYSHALGLIYPSEYEGFGLPVLEAMSCGCPVICSSVSSLPEVGGEAALYCDPMDASTIERRMEEIYGMTESERRSMKENSLLQASRFSWKGHAAELVAVLDDLELNRSLEGSSGSSDRGRSKMANKIIMQGPGRRSHSGAGSGIPESLKP